jgi:hypothetical protein
VNVRLADVVLVAWAAIWAGLAVGVFFEVRGLRDVSDTLVRTGHAIDRTGAALETLADVPILGERVRGYAAEVRRAGRSAQKSGRTSRGHVETLAVLLALAVGLIPTAPLIALYVPLRRVLQRGVLRGEVGGPSS